MPSQIRLFPLNTVLFPGAALHLHVFEPRYKQMIAECLDEGQAFGVCLIREGNEAGDPLVDPHEIGTTAEIDDVTTLPFGRYYVSTVGKRRFKIHGIVKREPYLVCDVEYLDDEAPDDAMQLSSVIEPLRAAFAEYAQLLVEYSGKKMSSELPEDPVQASFAIGGALQVADMIKQRLLETAETERRLRIELEFLRRLLPQLRSLLERKEPQRSAKPAGPLGGEARSHQEQHFGKFFSLN